MYHIGRACKIYIVHEKQTFCCIRFLTFTPSFIVPYFSLGLIIPKYAMCLFLTRHDGLYVGYAHVFLEKFNIEVVNTLKNLTRLKLRHFNDHNKFNPSKSTFKSFSYEEEYILTIASERKRTGTSILHAHNLSHVYLHFGTRGFALINPEEISTNKHIP